MVFCVGVAQVARFVPAAQSYISNVSFSRGFPLPRAGEDRRISRFPSQILEASSSLARHSSTNDMKLAGKHVLVTGGSAGLVFERSKVFSNWEGRGMCQEICGGRCFQKHDISNQRRVPCGHKLRQLGRSSEPICSRTGVNIPKSKVRCNSG